MDLVGEPRLVRLNPNIPWKTRGNAALSARFGRGVGARRRVGEVYGRPVWSYARGRSLPPAEAETFRERAWDRVRSRSRVEEPGTDPALVAVARRLPAELYWRAVREVVPVRDVELELDHAGAWWRTARNPRGLVGAAAAVAWPGAHPTWELTSYRRPGREGTPRRVEADSVRRVAARYPSLFLSTDPRTRRVLVAPHTACPVLLGLRSTRPGPLFAARRHVESEPVDRWVLFRTNQGTGDHLVRRAARDIAAYGSARLRATVRSVPTVLRGGHVRLDVVDAEGTALSCLAFEPTKTLPRVAAELIPGDRLVLWGSRGKDPTFRLEGIRVVGLAPRHGPVRPPRCASCRARTRTLGTGRGYRCPSCHARYPPEAGVRPFRGPPHLLGDHHPTPSARRHLAPRAPEP